MLKIAKQSLILSVVIALLLSLSISAPTKAAVPSLDKIRVALFVDIPKKYSSITKVATLSSESAMRLSVKTASNSTEWLNFPGNDQLRLAMNDYKVNVFESTDFTAAQQVYKAVKTAGGTPFLTSLSKNDKVTFQVLEGGYASNTDATAAVKKWTSNATVANLLKSPATVYGPFALESGSYATKADAQVAATKFGAQGLNTTIGMKLNSTGKLEYSVVVGMVGTTAELGLVKTAASKVSSTLKDLKGSENMLLMRIDHSATDRATSSNELYLYNPHLIVSLKADKEGLVKITERSERSYRGTMELGSLNNSMYVVNELPFEQYLYSVVAIEMYPSWPLEALKSQAVAARTYALYSGSGFVVANVVDTTTSQAYYGANSESANTTKAVDETKGEVITYNGKLIETLYSANAGGITADAKEIWNNEVAYLKSVSSPDAISEKGLYYWYRVVLPNGKVGYIREDLAKDTGKTNEAGKPILLSNTDATNIRRNPLIQSNVPAVDLINSGVQLIALEKVIQSNSMNWRRGPYSSDEIAKTINAKLPNTISGNITSFTVSKVGVSGRALEVSANGKVLPIPKPFDFRAILGVDGSLQSTLFSIEETGKIVILGANKLDRTKTDGAKALQVVGANGNTATVSGEYMYVLDGSGNVRAATTDAGYQYNGTGNGHGVGMSQYGAYALAEQGYDYQYILKYYYTGTTVTKDE
ncbi:SpoIID/LytB domain-containing protein [Paenibacillus endoradicis]|uniref:SpoIID/LytB domain-containing protein n=1 Tax=Paenibacillus endoradicis TaxID=2972487 RepID=UPI00215993C1|nr:SpoIID/LytB domain-containing protein [Paenibacillus endoradicis]MCR8655736.1 SpoIID/LytB domain-containing protein [Paenibacillus endoradicis]MCR8658062.1 SpoIID/LytB domain-containing protein [Paenibacillus endoradicis]